MSFVISANRLFGLTQSPRLHKLTQGRFSVQVLPSSILAPYRCDLSAEAVEEALDIALAGTNYLSDDRAEERRSFIDQLLKVLKISEVCKRPTVHAELAMIMAMSNGEINNVFPYVGVSKLSCIMCSHYLRAFNEVTQQKILTKGSHGKAYPGWFWPSLHDRDEELRPAFLRRIRQQLFSDFEQHAETRRRLSDSNVRSDGPGWEIGTRKHVEWAKTIVNAQQW